ncbi:MAG: IS481 family transposase [Halobacteriovoraceae bacterium]|nr:IS481 family transposase [Halobacteriovoraceae bacterium]|tara:strand:+ start:70 stop:1152 length:1083 start_codon:yes stop_codon:yes gene_type:complete
MSYLQSNTTIIKNKVGLLNLAQELGNISKACKVMGFSRDTFYRYQNAVEEGGVESLINKTRRKPNVKNRIDPTIEDAVIKLAIDEPAWGQVRVSNELRKQAISVSPAGVRNIWLRHDLENMKKRLKALEEKVAKEGIVLTESQLKIMEQKKLEKEAYGEIETEHPGYLGSQDTFYVGTLKGVGRIYQQTFVDTYSKVSFCKLYNMKTPITAADLLNDKVLPVFEEHKVPMLRMLTDRGTEYCGKIEQHDYQLFLAVKNIDHTKTKAKHPQTNGIVERFHKTILNEFYQVAFRKRIYDSLEMLQGDLDDWLEHYNKERTHQGKMCYGRTPWQTFLDGKKIVEDKMLSGKFSREVLESQNEE